MLSASLIDMLTNPAIISNAWKYHKEVQTKETKYVSFVDDDTRPATHLNKEIMEQYRPLLKKFYYDPLKYNTYLEQLGVDYPQLDKKNE